jgi:hypothetical protein
LLLSLLLLLFLLVDPVEVAAGCALTGIGTVLGGMLVGMDFALDVMCGGGVVGGGTVGGTVSQANK